MRDSISALVIVTAIALAGCTAGNQRTDGIETLPSVPEERYTPAATSSFPGEAGFKSIAVGFRLNSEK